MQNPMKLVPRRLFFDPPEKQLVRISPNGEWIAFHAPVGGVLNLWVAPIDKPDSPRALTCFTDRRIGPALVWAHDNRHVLIFRDNAGDENWRIWSVDIETGKSIPLSPGDGAKAYVQQRSRHYPNEVLLAHNARDKRYFDIFRVNVETGANSLLMENNGFFGVFTDQYFKVRFVKKYDDDGEMDYLHRDETGEWSKVVGHILVEDSLTTWPVEYSDNGDELWWIDSRGRDKAALVAENTKTGSLRVLAEDKRADIHSILLDPVTRRPIAAASMFDRVRWTVLDPEFQGDFDAMAVRFHGEIGFTSISTDGSRIIIAHAQDTHPMEYFCYDRKTRQSRRLFSAHTRLENVPLVPMEPKVVKARGGLDVLCYLSRPTSDGDGPAPMVLLVHGGPWSRDVWCLSPMHQWLASRGYAVLSVNYRGSRGFGKSFINAADREWGGKMHDDLIDAVDWAIAEGIADRNRVAIMGSSYGGYAALVGLTFTPERFECAIDLVGISNLVTFVNSIPEYWRTWQSQYKVRMGDFTTEEGRRFLEQRSPLNYIDRIQRPLLIAQGANDVRVKVAESDQIVAAMQERGIPVTYLLYSDEGHGLERAENKRACAAVVEAFLAEHLGGQCEPVGEDFEGSSIQFVAGRDLIVGLQSQIS
jgi:dipeptidyl aminopeptidase/acylaminoacyl peptidase